MTALDLLTLSMALATSVLFGWAMRRYFHTEGAAARAKTSLSWSAYVWTVVQFAVLIGGPAPSSEFRAAGIVLFACSQALFWWAKASFADARPAFAFVRAEPVRLNLSGPYRWIRHPFYTSYLLGWIAGAVATAQFWLLAAAIWMGAFYYRAACREESELGSGPFAAVYENYRRRTGMFWPTWRRVPRAALCEEPGQ